MWQLPLAILPAAQPRFDSFFVGANAAALAHLQQGTALSAPLYLWGPAGSGKTHLLRAWVHEGHSRGEGAGWFNAQDAEPWELRADWVRVVVDGCEQLDAARQHAAFRLFVEAQERGVQWAAAGRSPPVDLALRDDLRSRLAWGHVFALQPLGEAETRAALRREADRRGIFLSDEVMAYLLTRFARDLKHLMALLDRLDDFALSQQRHITVPLLRQMLRDSEAGAAT